MPVWNRLGHPLATEKLAGDYGVPQIEGDVVEVHKFKSAKACFRREAFSFFRNVAFRLVDSGKVDAESISWDFNAGGPAVGGDACMRVSHGGQQLKVRFTADAVAPDPFWDSGRRASPSNIQLAIHLSGQILWKNFDTPASDVAEILLRQIPQ